MSDDLVQPDAVEHEAQDDEFEEYEPVEKSAPSDRAELGPLDDAEAPVRPYIDLGGLKVLPREGLQMRLEVDERTKRLVAATLVLGDSTLQLQPFAAPRSEGIWHPVRQVLGEQLRKQGAKVIEEDGALGPELHVAIQAGAALRKLRLVGVDGPRWMLQGLISGEAADGGEAYDRIVDAFRAVVVVRGQQPMPPRDLIPLRAPVAPDSGDASKAS